jgi:glycosyltransferase involved in cell wall biosynthesis
VIEVSVLMPVYNERVTVERAIAGVLAGGISDSLELIVIDDGSVDGTRELLREREWPPQVKLVFHERNLGKGAALRTGLAEATGEFATVMDADLEYSPSDISLMLDPLRDRRADVVYGTRTFKSHSAFSFWYVVGNRAVTLFANFVYNSWVSDLMTGQKALRTEIFRSLHLRERGFAIEAEITARILRSGTRIYEVPIEYVARTREEGKKLTALDGLRVVRTLLRCRFI